MKALFAKFGEILSVKVKDDSSEQAFVQFKDHTSAKNALEELNAKHEIQGQVIFVSKHISKSNNTQGGQMPPITQQMKETFASNIFVRFIPKDVTEDEFKEKMSKAGKIISYKFKDYEQKSKSGETHVNWKVGYVCYEDVKQAQKCI